MSQSIGIAFVGCGTIAEDHLRVLTSMDGVYLRAFCDIRKESAERFRASCPGSYATNDLAKVLRDGRVDAVYICTRNDSHASIGIAAARAGKHIMMEKPVALTLSECSALAEAVESSGVCFMTAFKFRFSSLVEKVRGFIPHPSLCVAQTMDRRWPDDFWGNDPLEGGGNVLSQGCHAADLLCHLMHDKPDEVIGHAGNLHHAGVEIMDTLAASVHFEGGGIGNIVLADAGEVPLVSKFSLQLMDGTRTAHLHDRLKRVVLFDGEAESRYSEAGEVGIMGESEEFVQAVLNGRNPSSTLQDGIRASVLLARALESSRTGRATKVSL